MSDESGFRQTSGLLAGRWQIPLALVAAVAAGLTLLRLAGSRPTAIDLEAVLSDIAALEESGDRVAAADAVANLLEMQPPLPPAQRAVLHARLAELLFAAERDQAQHDLRNVKKLLAHDQSAGELGQPESALGLLRQAFAYQWLGQNQLALSRFQAALAAGLPTDQRRQALRAIAELLEGREDAAAQRRQALEQLLDDQGISVAHFWWGLREAVQDALDRNDVAAARRLLESYGPRLKNSRLRGYLEYLWACLMLQEGRVEEAAPLVRWIEGWMAEQDQLPPESESLESLSALTRHLAGQIELAEDRPEDALASFEQVLRGEPGPELRVMAGLGRGFALARLDRHAAAVEAFRSAFRDAGLLACPRRPVRQARKILFDLFEQRRERGDDQHALLYLALATELAAADQPERRAELFERLGQAYRAAAERAVAAEQRRSFHEQAGEALERALEPARFDEARLAELLWLAADQYDRAGRIRDMKRLLEQFVQDRSEHPQLPAALLQLGRASEACGDLAAALQWYGRVMAEYPRLEEATRATVLYAGVLISLGQPHYAEAERTLVDLLTGGLVAPSAVGYRDGLLALCELLYHQGRYGEAISRLEDFLELYPQDEERFRAAFLLANAHRRSAYALRPSAGLQAGGEAAAIESRHRFRVAAERFQKLLRELEAAGLATGSLAGGGSQPAIRDPRLATRDPALEIYARLALFYAGDCLFELDEPETLQAALAAYRNAAVRYDGQPPALSAQVQIANVLLRLGDRAEAGRAVERARWLLRRIPPEAFAGSGGVDRQHWERFLSVVSSSDLLNDAFDHAP